MSKPTNDLRIQLTNGVRVIQFNRPKKKNAFSLEIYRGVANILNTDANDDNVKICVISGSGDYFSSGNDITNSKNRLESTDTAAIKSGRQDVSDFVKAFIDYPKLLIAVVNGPAIGAAVTILALCDIVYASERATFQTPFSRLGLCPEACSSYTFPRIMGKSKANEMLYLNYKMGAAEALRVRFVSEIFKHSQLSQLWKRILKIYSGIPLNSILITKNVMRKYELDLLHEVNKTEMSQLQECFKTDEFKNAVKLFFAKTSKL